MYKYLAIINRLTILLLLVCALVTYLCIRLDFGYSLNVTLFSIAVVFPLVFTIREAFKRRDNALEFLSQFKSALISVHYSLEHSRKLSREHKDFATAELQATAELFLATLRSDSMENEQAQRRVNGLIGFLQAHRKELSTSAALKIIRFLQDVHEAMDNTLSIKRHGTPVSLRAYCLVFVFVFPIVFTPTIVYHLGSIPVWIIYAMSLLHGFVLISLYNVQADMENPFDDIGLDDIKLEGFRFLEMAAEAAPKPKPGKKKPDPPPAEPDDAATPDAAATPEPDIQAQADPEALTGEPDPDSTGRPGTDSAGGAEAARGSAIPGNR